MKLFNNKALLISCFLFITHVLAAQSVKYQDAVWLKIDTDHVNERYEWSPNPMTVLLKDENGNVLAKRDYTILMEFTAETSSATQVVLKSSGADAILIDAMGFFVIQTILTETENGWVVTGEKVIRKREWGQDNARVWCLSTDPNDVNGEWKDVTNACDAQLTYDIGTGEIYLKNGEKNKNTDQIITTKPKN